MLSLKTAHKSKTLERQKQKELLFLIENYTKKI